MQRNSLLQKENKNKNKTKNKETPMVAMMPPKMKQELVAMKQFPKRLGKPEEFAALVRHIAENTFLNGEVIRIDAAVRMQP